MFIVFNIRNDYMAVSFQVYLSEKQYLLNVAAIQGKCYVRRKHDISSLDYPAIYDHIFFCEHLYDANSGAIKQVAQYFDLIRFKNALNLGL